MGGEPCSHRGTPRAVLVFRRLARVGEVDRLERGGQLGQVGQRGREIPDREILTGVIAATIQRSVHGLVYGQRGSHRFCVQDHEETTSGPSSNIHEWSPEPDAWHTNMPEPSEAIYTSPQLRNDVDPIIATTTAQS